MRTLGRSTEIESTFKDHRWGLSNLENMVNEICILTIVVSIDPF